MVVDNTKPGSHWGYRPVCDNAGTRNRIKRAGYTPVRYGARTQEGMQRQASRIEAATGIEMVVFRHQWG